jgi:hypothetical protein
VSRFTADERRRRREAQDEMALLGEDWLAIREAGAFLLAGCASWDEYVARVVAPKIPARWGLSAEQTVAFVDEAMRLAEMRRRVGGRS